MNENTGEIINEDMLKSFPVAERRQYIPITRDLTKKEAAEKQILLYGPCGCGSGKKFKFCCHKS